MARRKRGRLRWLTPVDRVEIERRLVAGDGPRVIAAGMGSSESSVKRVRADMWLRRRVTDSGFRLGFEERVGIEVAIARGDCDAQIARQLGRHRATIGREIGRCRSRRCYRAVTAQRRADGLARRPKQRKLAGNRRLVAAVEAGLMRRWSPQQISATLKRRFPHDPGMQISHETIYLSLFVQSRGQLRRQLTAQLRTGRTARKPQGRRELRGRIVDMLMLSERPAEVADRAVPGHWEGDLLMGAHGRSAVATLVERHTRYVLLGSLGGDHSTERVIKALTARIQTLPAHLVKSLTWDQGKELAAHRRFSVDTGVQVYFCDPHSPWQRGSNENTNGLLRQYLPKGSDLSVHDQTELDRIAAELNGRPRQTLGWDNPAERMAQLIREAD